MPSAGEALRRQSRRVARRRALRGKTAVLFGASVLAAQVKDELERHGVPIHAVVDNDPDKIGRNYHGLLVQRPEEVLVPYRDEYVVIVVAFAAAREMLHQVETLGYRKRRQAFVLSPLQLDESVKSFIRFAPHLLRGRLTYTKLTGGNPDSTLFVAPYAGTGDMYLIELFLQSFVEREGIRDYSLAVASNACAQVALMMGESRVAVADQHALNSVISYGRLIRARPTSIVVLNDGWMGAPTEWLRGYKGLNFEKMFRHTVFGLGDEIAPQIPGASSTNEAVLKLFDEQGLVPGRTVVLSPYANTLFHVPDPAFWATVVARCAERGLTVCTNCGPKEQPIAGTKAARFPLSLAPDLIETAGYFVGVRSGFCDIVSGTASRKVVLYDREGRFYKGSFHEYFSLAAMGLGRNLREVEYAHGDKEHIVTEVMEGLT
ncbi:MAG: hypothetical protein ACRDPA_16245 [Solirubrobacteraceae bacterium]